MLFLTMPAPVIDGTSTMGSRWKKECLECLVQAETALSHARRLLFAQSGGRTRVGSVRDAAARSVKCTTTTAAATPPSHHPPRFLETFF